MITAAAIQVNEKIYTLPQPARHADIIEYFRIAWNAHRIEGFLDERNHFYTRAAAMQHAKSCKQPLIDFWSDLDAAAELYSENLW